MTKIPQVTTGVFGGSGFYSFLDIKQEFYLNTPYGAPSDKIVIGELEGKDIAFIPRHGREHSIPPHMINYRANVYAMYMLGVKHLMGPCAAGSLQPQVKPGDFVICDQFVDRTKGRIDTFYDGPKTNHVSSAEPYCPDLRKLIIESAKELNISCHEHGTVVIVQGPRFSTRAESRWYSGFGWEVINMTQYPECYLARELEICYANISLITDYDTGLEGHPEIKPVTYDEVMKVFKENNEKLRKLLFSVMPKISEDRKCICSNALSTAGIN
ncbi:MAG: S-methyl-5'-thioadenosine phosphorylase [Actinobacteria bacterium]|nr:S-methyl-5'-thioadenosine phosphorylase [Actinomycetota bacterium]